MFAHKKNYGRAGYVDDPLPNIHCIYGYLDACMHCMALLCIQLDCVGVFEPFFFLLSVWSPCYTLSRKKEKRNREEEKS